MQMQEGMQDPRWVQLPPYQLTHSSPPTRLPWHGALWHHRTPHLQPTTQIHPKLSHNSSVLGFLALAPPPLCASECVCAPPPPLCPHHPTTSPLHTLEHAPPPHPHHHLVHIAPPPPSITLHCHSTWHTLKPSWCTQFLCFLAPAPPPCMHSNMHPPSPPCPHYPTTSLHRPTLLFNTAHPETEPVHSVSFFCPGPFMHIWTCTPTTTLSTPPHHLPLLPYTTICYSTSKTEPQWLSFILLAKIPPPLFAWLSAYPHAPPHCPHQAPPNLYLLPLVNHLRKPSPGGSRGFFFPFHSPITFSCAISAQLLSSFMYFVSAFV